jgi:hypothetical protein
MDLRLQNFIPNGDLSRVSKTLDAVLFAETNEFLGKLLGKTIVAMPEDKEEYAKNPNFVIRKYRERLDKMVRE